MNFSIASGQLYACCAADYQLRLPDGPAVLGGLQRSWSVGEEVAVRYDPADPAVVVAAGSSSTMLFISGAIALVLGLAGAMILFVRK